MADLTDELPRSSRTLVRARMRLIHAAWAFLMRCFKEPE